MISLVTQHSETPSNTRILTTYSGVILTQSSKKQKDPGSESLVMN